MLPDWMRVYSPDSSHVDIRPFNPLALIILLVPLFILHRRGKKAGYLLCFSLFFLYMWAVFAIVLCPLPVSCELAGSAGCTGGWDVDVNWVPSLFSGRFDLRSQQVYGNFLLGLPFGFGLPFLLANENATPRRMLGFGLGFALGLELAQFILGVLIFPYRSIDIDDVLLVFAGTMVGYGLLRVTAYGYRRLGWAGAAREKAERSSPPPP